MSMNKKLLATAVAGSLYLVAASASAAVNISSATPASLKYASEIVTGTAGVALANTAANDLAFNLGYNFSDAEVRYARMECTNLKFGTVAGVSSSDPNVILGSVNKLSGSSVVTFSVTDNSDGTAQANSTDVLTIDAGYTLLGSGDVSCTYSLYDQPSQASAGGTAGRIVTTTGTFIKRASGVTFTTDPHTLLADVEAVDGAYTDFKPAGWNNLGDVQFTNTAGVLKADGSQITLADIFSSAELVFSGDFNAFDDVQFNAASLTVAADGMSAVYDTALANSTSGLWLLPNNEDQIPAGDYNVSLDVAVNTGYAFAGSTKLVGTIKRNGTQLQAPLAQVPAGWLSRMVLTNTGSIERAYAVEVMGEEGNVIGTANLTGTIPAHGTKVVDLTSVLKSFTGAPRATLNVTVSAPNNDIQGLYQIVNPASGSISNETMVRPGQN